MPPCKSSDPALQKFHLLEHIQEMSPISSIDLHPLSIIALLLLTSLGRSHPFFLPRLCRMPSVHLSSEAIITLTFSALDLLLNIIVIWQNERLIKKRASEEEAKDSSPGRCFLQVIQTFADGRRSQ